MKSKKVDDNKSKQPKYAIRNKEDKQINNKKNNPVKNGQRPKDSYPKNTYRWLIKHMKRYPTSLIIQLSSVAQSCPTLCDPMDCSMPDFPVHHQLPELAQTHVHWVSSAIQPSHPLLSSSPPAFNLGPSIRVFSNESVLHIRWPKYWSFSFSISPSNECSGFISFRIDWFDSLAVPRTLKSLP